MPPATARTPRPALPVPATTWYLAEGSTSGDFSLFYLLQNPNPTRRPRRCATCCPSASRRSSRTYTLAAALAHDDPGRRAGAGAREHRRLRGDHGARRRSSSSARCTRSTPGQAFAAGHESAGVTAPATRWFLAEGATGPFFDLFILLANPDDAAGRGHVDYLLIDGRTLHARATPCRPTAASRSGSTTSRSRRARACRPLDNVAVSTRHVDQRRADHRRADDVVAEPGADGELLDRSAQLAGRDRDRHALGAGRGRGRRRAGGRDLHPDREHVDRSPARRA